MAPVEQTERVMVPGTITQAPPFPWNHGVSARVTEACVHTLVAAQARRTPNAAAVSGHGRALTYAQLDARANQVARRLRREGVGPDVLVGVFMERTPELLVALLGVLKAGGAYVPLDPAYPRARLELMLADTRAPVLITQPALAGRLPSGGAAVLALDDACRAVADESAEPFESGATPENLSHVIYTSGSTGIPKGVMIRHSSVSTLIEWAPKVLGIETGRSVLASTSVCFDVHVAETWVPLALGARVVLVPNALHMASLPAGETVDVASMVPSAIAELLRMGGIPASLRSINLAGEALRNELAQDLYQALPGLTQVVNVYGPTEDTTYSTWHVTARGTDRPMPIGVPLDGSRTYVLDEALRPATEGETGEIWLAGAGVARGYRGRPAATAERFLPDPWSPDPGARMYRTGDLGRGASDGMVECLGRVDHQVKVRGFRVELGEVEDALRRHPAVADTVAAVRENALVAYVAPTERSEPAAAELKAWLGERLPDYMVPSFVVTLAAIPRLPNGKVDRGALPEPEVGAPERTYVAPRTPAEATVCAIWAEVLGAERIGAEDDFFDLGGHSLRATQVVARVREALGAELSPFAVFDLRTPAALARAAEEAAAAPVDEVPALVPVPRDRPIPLSFSQQAIWFFQALSPGMRSYNFQAAIRFHGELDVPALERSLAEIVRRHEIFRTEFRAVDGEPRQFVRDPWPVRLPVADLRSFADAVAREAELERLLRDEFLRPFHLDRLPLVRWTLYRTGDDEHVLAAVEHHFVHDGWSFGRFLQELAALYAAFAEGRPSPLDEPEVQFADYAVWQRRWMHTTEAERQLSYWRRKLAGLPPVLELPSDRPRPAVMSFQGRSIRRTLAPELARAAQAFSRRHGVTLYVTLMAAYQALVHRYTGAEDFAVGGGVANRNERAAECLIGMIVNTVALRADVSGDPTVRELLERVRATTSEAYAHREIPFGEVVEAVQPQRSLSHLPIYQTAFSFHDAPYPAFELPRTRMRVTEALSNESAKFDLQVIVIPRGSQQAGAEDEVTMIWEYATDLFDGDTVERMEAHYRTVLAGLLADEECRISALPLLADEERTFLVDALNATGADYPGAGLPVHRRFEAWADRAPAASAVATSDTALTYGEMEAAANRVANALRARGVERGDRVAVCMERAAGLPVALLGVLKAGAAYVPIDPAYPAERIGWMLEDSGAGVLLAGTERVGEMAGFGLPVLGLDGSGGLSESASSARPSVPVEATDLAYVIYTSGSTGRPKGVMVEHGALANLANWHQAEFAVTPADRATLVAGVGFDASAWETWPYLAGGASLHVVPESARTDPAALRDWLVEEGITISFLPTPLAETVLPLAWPDTTALRRLLVGGDRLRVRPSPSLPFALVNNYGPTENTVVSTSGPVASEGEGTPGIGRPIGNTTAYVLDPHLNPVPVGVPGELFVGGAQVARGYLNQPVLTEERFVRDPFSGASGARLYRTGDRVRVARSGEIEFLGRTDFQVKVRGFRVEPGEVEAALRTHPAVTDAVCAAREEGGSQRLVAWVVADADDATLPAALREHLRGLLPEYMVPAAIGIVSAFPVTPNGKVDVAALPTPDGARTETAQSVPPRTERERVLAELVAGVVGAERVGIHDNFFDLGGDSILAMQLVSRAREAGFALTTRQVFEHQTVAGLAEHAGEVVEEAFGDAPALLDAGELDELMFALGQAEDFA